MVKNISYQPYLSRLIIPFSYHLNHPPRSEIREIRVIRA